MPYHETDSLPQPTVLRDLRVAMRDGVELATDVYLPAGRSWVDAGSGTRHDGGTTLRATVSSDRIPVFAREGAEVLDVIR